MRRPGVPIGSPEFVQQFVANKAGEIIRDVEKVQVVTDSFIHFHLLRFCQNTRLAYLNQSEPPEVMVAGPYNLKQVDLAIVKAILGHKPIIGEGRCTGLRAARHDSAPNRVDCQTETLLAFRGGLPVARQWCPQCDAQCLCDLYIGVCWGIGAWLGNIGRTYAWRQGWAQDGLHDGQVHLFQVAGARNHYFGRQAAV